jgi:hypothetical protein
MLLEGLRQGKLGDLVRLAETSFLCPACLAASILHRDAYIGSEWTIAKYEIACLVHTLLQGS